MAGQHRVNATWILAAGPVAYQSPFRVCPERGQKNGRRGVNLVKGGQADFSRQGLTAGPTDGLARVKDQLMVVPSVFVPNHFSKG